MPGTLYNASIPNLIGGVSQQATELRPENMVSDMVNCIPSLTQGVIRRNPVEAAVQLLDSHGYPVDTKNSFIYMYDRGNFIEKYLFVIPGNGHWYIYNAHTRTGEPIAYSTSQIPYLVNKTILPTNAVFKCVTIADHTFIINKTIKAEMLPIKSAGLTELNSWAFYWITKVAAYPVGDGTDDLEGYKYTLNNATVQGYTGMLDSYSIAEELADRLNYDYGYGSPFIFKKDLLSSDTWTWSDSFGNTASLGVHKEVRFLSELPASLPPDLHGFICKVTGDNTVDEDNFYYQYDSKTNTWGEIVAPDVEFKLNPRTMPHVFYRLNNEGVPDFVFDTFQKVEEDGSGLTGEGAWGDKKAGDDVSSPLPSFVGKSLSDMFFHKGRLGFITGNNIILSEVNDYGNFFPKSVQMVLDDGPIDVAVATTEVTVLRATIDSPRGLLIFADYDQFILTSPDNGPLTPTTATVIAISHYPFNNQVAPLHIGNKIYFASNESGSTNIYAYQVSDNGAQTTKAYNMTQHVPSYIPDRIGHLVGHNVLGYLFMIDKASTRNNLYIITNLEIGNNTVQNAVHRWGLTDVTLEEVYVLNNYVYLIDDRGGLHRINLQEPSNIWSVIYKDATIDTPDTYVSRIIFSEFYYRDKTKLALFTGRTQLRTIEYALDELGHYQTRIANLDRYELVDDSMFGPRWDDEDAWADRLTWMDEIPYYTRVYKDDKKVTVMGNTKTTRIAFENNEDDPYKGFALTTFNMEYLLHQRGKYKV